MALDTHVTQYFRAKAGAFGAPPTAGLTAADAGLLAINLAGHDAAEKAAGLASLYSYDAATWIHLNPKAAVAVQAVDLNAGAGAGTANPGVAWAALTPAMTGDIVIGTHGAPTASAYLLTNSALPNNPASWTALGSATAVASGGEISAGADNVKMITAAGLRGEITRLLPGTSALTAAIVTKTGGAGANANQILLLDAGGLIPATALPLASAGDMTTGTEAAKLVTPKLERDELARALTLPTAKLAAATATLNAPSGTPANDVNALVRLNAAGKINAGFLSVTGLNFLGAADLAAAIPAPPAGGFKNGDIYTNNNAATVAPLAAWGFPADVVSVETGDMALYDGTSWHHLATGADLTGVVLKAASNAMTASAKLLWADPGVANTVILDGAVAANAVLQNMTLKTCRIGGGTF